MRIGRRHLVVLLAVAAVAAALAAGPGAAGRSARVQSTQLISRSFGGGQPNGPSTNGVISDDRRFARVIAFQSSASNIVRGDTDGVTDVFAVFRAGPVANNGAAWKPGRTIMVSRTFTGQPADGPSFAPAVDGNFRRGPSCVAFLSAASNLVPGDTNGTVDAFVSRGPGGLPERVSLPGNQQSTSDTTAVAVSGDCSRIAFVTGGVMYVRVGGQTHTIKAPGVAGDPSFSTGQRSDLVFGAARGVYLSRGGAGGAQLVAPGGSNPAYNDIKQHVIAYQKRRGGRMQVFFRGLGGREHVASARRGRSGNGDSTNPVIGNSGFYIAFETKAGNLQSDAGGAARDRNHKPDVYLYTDVRHITLLESVKVKGVTLPGGGQHPSMSFYANYILFDTAAPLGRRGGAQQVYMRYLGGL
jgi:hypothetical protein